MTSNSPAVWKLEFKDTKYVKLKNVENKNDIEHTFSEDGLRASSEEIENVYVPTKMDHNLELAGESFHVTRLSRPSNHLHCDSGDFTFDTDASGLRLHHNSEGAAS